MELSYTVKSRRDWKALQYKTMRKRELTNAYEYVVEDPNKPGSIIIAFSSVFTMIEGWDSYYLR